MCKRYNMHANKVKKYVLSNYPASALHLKTVGGLTHSMCLIHWGLQGIYTRLLLIMKLISVYLEYIVVSEYTPEQNSLVKRNDINLLCQKEGKSLVSGKSWIISSRAGPTLVKQTECKFNAFSSIVSSSAAWVQDVSLYVISLFLWWAWCSPSFRKMKQMG